jgi:5'-nucleotidase
VTLAAAAVTVTLLHFSDYHSHALPFYSEQEPDQGGIARAVALFERAKARPGTFLLSGGDMLNQGTPAWSDEHRCVEWPWLAGLVDAMALGNHDLDYGPAEFERCRRAAGFPVLSANLLGADGAPHLEPYVVKEHAGVRVGFFAVAGPEVQRLVRPRDLPPGTRWGDAGEAARATVRALREREGSSAVVLIGHQSRDEDAALARAVPGIDLILGSHSHLKVPLGRIEGTSTWYSSPYQYLAYVGEVRLGFDERAALVSVEGDLLRMDAARPEHPATRERVARLQRELEGSRPERFEVLAVLPRPLSDAGVTHGESEIGNWATDRLRRAARAHAFFSTASSFRGALPPGALRLEDLLSALPYTNEIVTTEMTGARLLEWLSLVVQRRGSDAFSQSSGVRYRIAHGLPQGVEVLLDPDDPARGFAPLEATARYRVATTDHQAFAAAGYRELFAGAGRPLRSGLDVHRVLVERLRAGDFGSELDGRVR